MRLTGKHLNAEKLENQTDRRFVWTRVKTLDLEQKLVEDGAALNRFDCRDRGERYLGKEHLIKPSVTFFILTCRCVVLA